MKIQCPLNIYAKAVHFKMLANNLYIVYQTKCIILFIPTVIETVKYQVLNLDNDAHRNADAYYGLDRKYLCS